jgi:hypothetical protein
VGFLSACSLFDNSRWNGNDPDAVQRAEDPYHTDPKYADPDAFNPRTQQGTDAHSWLNTLFFGDNKKSDSGGGAVGIGVNSLLWRASLDTISFMPLASADPFGGVIITDWYSPPDSPNERFKVNLYILSRELRADGIRASVFHQRRGTNGQWTDAPIDKATDTDLENAILTRARQIRLSTAAAQ